jgi:hypothetical protein
MEPVRGYFTIERNILGLNLREMEFKLGFPPGWLAGGARVLLLLKQPSVGKFVYAGSTRYPDARGLVGVAHRQNFPIPHAWLNQRLVKVKPIRQLTAGDDYPAAKEGAIEQWQLVEDVMGEEVCRLLNPQQKYWGR